MGEREQEGMVEMVRRRAQPSYDYRCQEKTASITAHNVVAVPTRTGATYTGCFYFSRPDVA